MRKKQKQKAPQSALETLLLVLLAALTLVPLFLVVQNSFKSRFYISGDPFALPNKETFVALENYIGGLSASGFFAAFGRSLLITVVSVGLIVLCTSMAAWYLIRLANVDMLYSQIKERYDRAVAWLTKVADGGLYPELPLITTESGQVQTTMRTGSLKFPWHC